METDPRPEGGAAADTAAATAAPEVATALGIYLRRRGKVLLPEPEPGAAAAAPALLPVEYAATLAKEAERLGYLLSPALLEGCRTLSAGQLAAFRTELLDELTRLRGGHREFVPLYPDFPAGVMARSRAELYLNALLHYWTDGRFRPPAEARERYPLLDEVELTPLDRGAREEFETLFAQIAGANAAFSEQDRADLAWFAAEYGPKIGPLLPAAVPQKENVAYLAALLLAHAGRETAGQLLGAFCRTATDVLRLAVALSGGDVSLAAPTKFRAFTRAERALLLGLLERVPPDAADEDLRRWEGRWLRLGERLHPGEYARRFPQAARAFQSLRAGTPVETLRGAVEAALAAGNVADAAARLTARPGEFARRLDHLLRRDPSPESQDAVLSAFAESAGGVSTPVLLQVRHHFAVRAAAGGGDLRVFFPKGSVAKARAVPSALPPLPADVCDRAVAACETALRARFGALPPLGRVYVDPGLREFMVPFALRSASKTLRTLVRGSRLPLPPCDVLRFFVWWRNGADRTDIDLSAALFGPDFGYVDVLSYYNLEGVGGVHSGDIVDAPEGAAEFIDITLAKVREMGVRYVVMSLNSYTRQAYKDLPECFAGWMARQKPGSGEIFEPSTVQDRLDITADSRIALPLIIDVAEERVIWCDLSLKHHPVWENNVDANLGPLQVTLRSLVEMSRPNLYDLFRLHAEARGTLAARPDEAEVVFSPEAGTPFRLEEIAADFMR